MQGGGCWKARHGEDNMCYEGCREETLGDHGVRKGSLSQQLGLEPDFEKWRDLS